MAITRRNLTIVGWLLIAGGALQILGAIFAWVGGGDASAIFMLSNAAIGVVFILLAMWSASTDLARVAYIIGAIGWLLLAVTSVVNLGAFGTIATFIAIVGSVFGGVVAYLGRVFTPQAIGIFFAAMIVGAVVLAMVLAGFTQHPFKDVVNLAFGALLIIAGVFVNQRK